MYALPTSNKSGSARKLKLDIKYYNVDEYFRRSIPIVPPTRSDIGCYCNINHVAIRRKKIDKYINNFY